MRKSRMRRKKFRRTPDGYKKIILAGGRVTYNPSEVVREIHKKFLAEDGVLEYERPEVKVMSHVRLGHTYYFKTDLKSAFDQVTYEMIVKYAEHFAIRLSSLEPREYFFHNQGEGGLIQGSLASPHLFETYCRFSGFDFDLQQYCKKIGFHYTRFADDLLFSAPRRIGGRVGPKVRQIVGHYGFALNDAKTRRVNTLEEPLEVLGYKIMGTRIDPLDKTIQKLYSPKYDEEQRWGIRKWRKDVKKANRQT